jgi:hypothetical protein
MFRCRPLRQRLLDEDWVVGKTATRAGTMRAGFQHCLTRRRSVGASHPLGSKTDRRCARRAKFAHRPYCCAGADIDRHYSGFGCATAKLLAAPSPSAGNQGAPRSSGKSLRRFCDASCGSSLRGSNFSRATAQRASMPSSHSKVCALSPVPLAIESPPVAFSLTNSRQSHSAGDLQKWTLLKRVGSTRRSHNSLAGQNEVRSMHPCVHAPALAHFFSQLCRFCAAPESAQVMIGVSGTLFSSKPSRLCQKHPLRSL